MYLQLISLRYVRFQVLNVKLKEYSEYHNESIKGSIPEPAQWFSRNSEKFTKLQGERP